MDDQRSSYDARSAGPEGKEILTPAAQPAPGSVARGRDRFGGAKPVEPPSSPEDRLAAELAPDHEKTPG